MNRKLFIIGFYMIISMHGEIIELLSNSERIALQPLSYVRISQYYNDFRFIFRSPVLYLITETKVVFLVFKALFAVFLSQNSVQFNLSNFHYDLSIIRRISVMEFCTLIYLIFTMTYLRFNLNSKQILFQCSSVTSVSFNE